MEKINLDTSGELAWRFWDEYEASRRVHKPELDMEPDRDLTWEFDSFTQGITEYWHVDNFERSIEQESWTFALPQEKVRDYFAWVDAEAQKILTAVIISMQAFEKFHAVPIAEISLPGGLLICCRLLTHPPDSPENL